MPRANRFFCGECGCSVAMSYPATGQWPEPNTLWLSAAFFPDDPQEFGDVVHMYPEERPAWCTSMPNDRSSNPRRSQTRAPPALRPAHTSRGAAVDRAGCDGEAITYMGGEHLCVVRDENFVAPALLSSRLIYAQQLCDLGQLEQARPRLLARA